MFGRSTFANWGIHSWRVTILNTMILDLGNKAGEINREIVREKEVEKLCCKPRWWTMRIEEFADELPVNTFFSVFCYVKYFSVFFVRFSCLPIAWYSCVHLSSSKTLPFPNLVSEFHFFVKKPFFLSFPTFSFLWELVRVVFRSA